MRRAAVFLPLLLAACGGAVRGASPAPPPSAAPSVAPTSATTEVPSAPPPIAQFQSVWTRDAGVQMRTDAGGVTLPYVFMRLEVLRADTTDLRVRCVHCPGTPEGWIPRGSVVHHPRTPEQAARMELADFVLAVRFAAASQDVQALRAVMPREFVHSLGPLELGLLETFAAWEREGYRTLDRMPFLLDRGVATVPGTPVWAAPPEYAAALGFTDLRAGFRRGPGGWEWIFLVRDGT